MTICTYDRELCFENKNIKNIAIEYLLQIPEHFKNTKITEHIVMPNHVHIVIFIDECRGLIYQTQNSSNGQTQNSNNVPINIKYDNSGRDGYDNSGRDGYDNSGRDKSRPYIQNNPMLSKSPTLGKIIRYYKAKTTHKIRQNYFAMFSWQRNYFERIIRNNAELNRIKNYIINNPVNWETDRNNPKNF